MLIVFLIVLLVVILLIVLLVVVLLIVLFVVIHDSSLPFGNIIADFYGSYTIIKQKIFSKLIFGN